MTDSGFLEMQTPILTASSPEGARDYLVPSGVAFVRKGVSISRKSFSFIFFGGFTQYEQCS